MSNFEPKLITDSAKNTSPSSDKLFKYSSLLLFFSLVASSLLAEQESSILILQLILSVIFISSLIAFLVSIWQYIKARKLRHIKSTIPTSIKNDFRTALFDIKQNYKKLVAFSFFIIYLAIDMHISNSINIISLFDPYTCGYFTPGCKNYPAEEIGITIVFWTTMVTFYGGIILLFLKNKSAFKQVLKNAFFLSIPFRLIGYYLLFDLVKLILLNELT